MPNTKAPYDPYLADMMNDYSNSLMSIAKKSVDGDGETIKEEIHELRFKVYKAIRLSKLYTAMELPVPKEELTEVCDDAYTLNGKKLREKSIFHIELFCYSSEDDDTNALYFGVKREDMEWLEDGVSDQDGIFYLSFKDIYDFGLKGEEGNILFIVRCGDGEIRLTLNEIKFMQQDFLREEYDAFIDNERDRIK